MIEIAGDDGSQSIAYSSSEQGSPALLISGDRNQVVAGYLHLSATGSGPAVILTGADNRLRLDLTIVTTSGLIAIQGSDGRDTIISDARSISGAIHLGAGDDYFQSNAGAAAPTVLGGDGDDVLTQFRGTTPLDFHGGAGNDWLNGGSAADRLVGDDGDDRLFGGDGADLLNGGTGDDRLEGGGGNDRLNGGGGNDLAFFTGLRVDYDENIRAGTGTVTDRRVDGVGTGTDTLTDVPILRFYDEQVDTRIAQNELRLSIAGQNYSNGERRYGLSAIDLAGAGSKLVNTALVEGTGLRFLRADPTGNRLIGDAAAVAIRQDAITVENTAGGSIVAVGDALGTVGAIESVEGTGYRYLGTGLSVSNAGAIRSAEMSAINLPATDLKLSNALTGEITAGGVAISVPNGPAMITNAGLISGAGGISAGQLDLDNTGTIRGGIGTGWSSSTIRNTGTIEGGYRAYDGLTLRNDRSSAGDLVIDLGSASYRTEGFTHSTIINTGTFAGDIAIGGAIDFRTAPGGIVFRAAITNSGTLTGDISSAPQVASLFDGKRPNASFAETVTNSGRIDGGIDLGEGADMVRNTGAITGTVRLGDGDDSISTLWGGIDGGIDGGPGNDMIDWSATSTGGVRFDLSAGTAAASGVVLAMTGFEALTGTRFADAILGTDAAELLVGGGGSDAIVGRGGPDRIAGEGGDDVLDGGWGNDRLDGGEGDDLIRAGGGFDRVEGGAGTDTLELAGRMADYRLLRADARAFLVSGQNATEIAGVEQVRFAAGGTLSWASVLTDAVAFDGLSYIASHRDLIQAFGADAARGAAHFAAAGFSEGRAVSFDALSYVASYADLRLAFGTNTEAATRHYITYGAAERRTVSFDALSYIASYADLRAAFGTDATAGARHYIQWGAAERRTVSFDSWSYLASYPDLILAFGADASAAANHYIRWGAAEHRGIGFDPLAYAAANPDVRAAYGNDRTALAHHYVQWGYAEHRSTAFPVATAAAPHDAVAHEIAVHDDGALSIDVFGGSDSGAGWLF